MVAMRMMQSAVDQIVGVIAMRHRFVAAPRSVTMRRLVAATTMLGAAAVGIGGAHLDDVLLDPAIVLVMQMPVVQVIHVPVVANRNMTAAGTVRVRVIGLRRCHAVLLPVWLSGTSVPKSCG
jgi:hypothetical protein